MKDFQQYVEALKNAGFDKNVATSSDEENVTYIAWLEEKASVSAASTGLYSIARAK